MVGNTSNAEERKKVASVASITSPAIDQPISNIVLTIDNITKDKINSIKLQVATDADCNNVTEEIPAKIEDGDLIFKPTKSAANNYYKFIFDCQAGRKNGLIQVSKIAYYKVGDAPVIVDITNTAETAYTIAKAKELIDAGEGLSESVYVKGTVSQASKELNPTFGSLSYYISDDGTTGNELKVFGGLSFKGEEFTSVDDINNIRITYTIPNGTLHPDSLLEQGSGLLIGAVIGTHRMTALFQVQQHAGPHHAAANPCNLHMITFLLYYYTGRL